MTPIDKGFESPSDPRVRDRSPHATALDFLPERLPRLPLGIGEVGQRRVADASQSGEEAKVFEHLAGSGRLGGTGARQLLRQRRHFGAGQGVASTALKRSRRRCNALTHTPCKAFADIESIGPPECDSHNRICQLSHAKNPGFSAVGPAKQVRPDPDRCGRRASSAPPTTTHSTYSRPSPSSR